MEAALNQADKELKAEKAALNGESVNLSSEDSSQDDQEK